MEMFVRFLVTDYQFIKVSRTVNIGIPKIDDYRSTITPISLHFEHSSSIILDSNLMSLY